MLTKRYQKNTRRPYQDRCKYLYILQNTGELEADEFEI